MVEPTGHSENGHSPAIIGLIGALPREYLLLTRSLPSIVGQTRQPDALVIATDRSDLSDTTRTIIETMLAPLPVMFTRNTGMPGISGTLNSGLAVISRGWKDCYVAILDDDDEWDAGHLALCHDRAKAAGWPAIVLSGMRVIKDGELVNATRPRALKAEDFLVGSCGWQGSNTFVKLAALQQAGCYTDGLISAVDRDTAFRLLSEPANTIAYTRKCSVTWYCGDESGALSAPNSPQKLIGLAQFYYLHSHKMTLKTKKAFFRRAKSPFLFEQSEILEQVERLPETWRQAHNVAEYDATPLPPPGRIIRLFNPLMILLQRAVASIRRRRHILLSRTFPKI
jgi:hypothetical protein